jgi:uncharacterized membrane protein
MIVALAVVIILGFLGLAIDLGYLPYMKRQLQKVAAAAALARAVERSYCGDTSKRGALSTAAEAARELDFAVLTTEVARCKGRCLAPHVGTHSGLRAMALFRQSLPHALGVSSDSTPGSYESNHHKGRRSWTCT